MTDRSLPILAVQAPAPSGGEDPRSQMREGDPVLELPLYDGALDPRRFALGAGGKPLSAETEPLSAEAVPLGAGAEPLGAGAERHPAR